MPRCGDTHWGGKKSVILYASVSNFASGFLDLQISNFTFFIWTLKFEFRIIKFKNHTFNWTISQMWKLYLCTSFYEICKTSSLGLCIGHQPARIYNFQCRTWHVESVASDSQCRVSISNPWIWISILDFSFAYTSNLVSGRLSLQFGISHFCIRTQILNSDDRISIPYFQVDDLPVCQLHFCTWTYEICKISYLRAVQRPSTGQDSEFSMQNLACGISNFKCEVSNFKLESSNQNLEDGLHFLD